jgi:hypothetical protein
VRYRVSEAATITFTVHRIEKGRKRGGSCQRPSASNKRGASCSRYVKVSGSFGDTAGAASSNALRFSGRLGGRTLKAGRYRLTAVARDAAGNVGSAQTATFRIR